MKKYLFNNAVALAVHALIMATFFLFQYPLIILYVTKRFYGTPTVVLFLVYFICGFFLKPVEKFSFLSVISVAAVIVIAWVCFFVFRLGSMYPSEYYLFNPIAFACFTYSLYIPDTLSLVLYYASLIITHLIPSLIMYAGIVLRKFIKRRFNAAAE